MKASKPLVLIVEDNKYRALDLEQAFKEQGFDVILASSTEEGAQLLSSLKAKGKLPDLIVSDLYFSPGGVKRGVAFIEWLRKQSATSNLLVLVYSALTRLFVKGFPEGVEKIPVVVYSNFTKLFGGEPLIVNGEREERWYMKEEIEELRERLKEAGIGEPELFSKDMGEKEFAEKAKKYMEQHISSTQQEGS